MDKTARNNWFGLQGMFLTTDPREARLGLPHGRYDIPLAITDRSFRRHNRLTNPFRQAWRAWPAWAGRARETIGDQVLVNGRFAPYQRVHPGSTGCSCSTRLCSPATTSPCRTGGR